jgi:hypothetical protein
LHPFSLYPRFRAVLIFHSCNTSFKSMSRRKAFKRPTLRPASGHGGFHATGPLESQSQQKRGISRG